MTTDATVWSSNTVYGKICIFEKAYPYDIMYLYNIVIYSATDVEYIYLLVNVTSLRPTTTTKKKTAEKTVPNCRFHS